MNPPISPSNFTIGQLLAHLRHTYQADQKALAQALQMSYATYLKTERDLREVSFLMALRVCQFYKLDVHEFISMLSDEELGRNEMAINKALQQRKRKKEELSNGKKTSSA